MQEKITRIGQKAVILNDQNEVLLIRRAEDMSRPLGWDYPGGGLNPGEDPREGIVREIREETGLEVTDVRLLDAVSVIDDTYDIVLLGYSARVAKVAVSLSNEHDQYRWVSVDQILDEDLPQIHKRFFTSYLKSL